MNESYDTYIYEEVISSNGREIVQNKKKCKPKACVSYHVTHMYV